MSHFSLKDCVQKLTKLEHQLFFFNFHIYFPIKKIVTDITGHNLSYINTTYLFALKFKLYRVFPSNQIFNFILKIQQKWIEMQISFFEQRKHVS